MKNFLIIVPLMLLYACKHPLAIEGEGDIVERLSGDRGCTLEEFRDGSSRCTDNEVLEGAYDVSYKPVPRPGWEFSGWEGLKCGRRSRGDNCDYFASAESVATWEAAVPDYASPPSTAVFRPRLAAIQAFYNDRIAGPVVASNCLDCHTTGGAAEGTRLLFSPVRTML